MKNEVMSKWVERQVANHYHITQVLMLKDLPVQEETTMI